MDVVVIDHPDVLAKFANAAKPAVILIEDIDSLVESSPEMIQLLLGTCDGSNEA